ncbi:MAG: hypothetical protein ABEK59_02370 [Halobacteria archaeon]
MGDNLVDLSTIVIAVLTFILIVTLWLSYLMYVRLRMVQDELEEVRSQVMITDDELGRLESSLENIKEADMIDQLEKRD